MRNDQIILSYDENADVLYVVLGAPVPAETDEDDNGLLLRFAQSDGHPCGVTVLDFRGSHWDARVSELSSMVATHLHIPTTKIRQALTAVA